MLEFIDAFSVVIDHFAQDSHGPDSRAGWGQTALADDAPDDLRARWESGDPELRRVYVTRDTPGRKRWHTRDDDGVLCYSGWLIESESGEAWEMAWAWSAADVGSVSILDGRWNMVIG